MNECWIPPAKRKYFGPMLKLVCKDKGVSLKRLARQVGISGSALYGYVSGKHQPTLPVIEALCDALDISADVLLGRMPYTSDNWYLIGDKIAKREL